MVLNIKKAKELQLEYLLPSNSSFLMVSNGSTDVCEAARATYQHNVTGHAGDRTINWPSCTKATGTVPTLVISICKRTLESLAN